MQDIDFVKKQSRTIELLRFPLIVVVVFVHMLPFEQKTLYLNLEAGNVYNIITEMISHHLGRLPVPCFFLFFGYFFFYKITEWNRQVYVSQLKKRIQTLIIPYLCWNMIYIMVIYLKNLFFYLLGKDFDDSYIGLNSSSLYNILWTGPINFPLWYLRDLIVMTILTPLFYYFFKYTKFIGLLLILVIYLSTIESNIPGLSTTAIFYFGLGAYMGQSKYNMLKFAISYGKIAAILAIITLVMTTYYTASQINEYWVRAFLIFGIIVVLFVGYQCTKYTSLKNKLISLAPTVFFIYGLHMIYILGWFKGGLAKSFLASSVWGMLLGYFVIPPLCIGLILIFYRLMKKKLPKTLNTITGNR
ncbi:acyltransferase [Elizabethkingia anophelis]|nr:acyltransferase [Elizabethkingia anophelis]MCT4209012.1 acyltransferase [Elizabethkingia anophelis]